MKNLILLYLALSFLIADDVFCYTRLDDLIANSYDWGRRRIDKPNFPSGPYEPESNFRVIVLKNVSTMSITIYDIRIISDVNGTAFEFDTNTLKNIQIQPNDSLYVPVKFHPKKPGIHELIIGYDNTAGSTTQTILRGVGIVPKIKTEDVDFGSTILQDYAHPNKRQVRFTNPDLSEWEFGDSVTIIDFMVLPLGNEISSDTSWGTEGFRFNKSNLNFPIKLAQGEFIEFDAEFVADKVPESRASLSSVSNAGSESASKWIGKGIAEGIRITAEEVTTCFNFPIIITCVVFNTGSSDLIIDSLAIQPLDSQSVGVFDFVNPSDAIGFALSAGSFRIIEVRYFPKKPAKGPIPPLTTHKANLLAYNSSLFTPVAVSETPMIGNVIHVWRTSSISLSNNIACIGDTVDVRILLNKEDVDLRIAYINDFEILVKYSPYFIKVFEEDIEVGDLINENFKIDAININDVKGEFVVRLSSKTDILNNPEGGEILKFKLRTYLPNYSFDSISIITHQILIECANCIDFYPYNTSLALCFFDYWRIINLSPYWNKLKNIRPNPVIEGKINIDFSLGYVNFTELKIYDFNGKIMSIPVSKILEPGLYNISVDVSNLAIGSYWCDLISGPLHETKMFIVK